MLENIKILLGISSSDKDDLLNLLINIAQNDAYNFCHLNPEEDDVSGLDMVIVKMVLQLFNKMEAEGFSSKSFGGASESYLSDYSDDVITALTRNRKLITL